eukprot:1160173-Pelagomonas_calceolata.AAC.3
MLSKLSRKVCSKRRSAQKRKKSWAGNEVAHGVCGRGQRYLCGCSGGCTEARGECLLLDSHPYGTHMAGSVKRLSKLLACPIIHRTADKIVDWSYH